MKFGDKLRMLRKQSRRSQQDMADAMAVSQTLYSSWERDKNIPDVFQALQLARLLGASLDYLADDALDEPAPQPTERQWLILQAAEAKGEREVLRWLIGGDKPAEGPRIGPGAQERGRDRG